MRILTLAILLSFVTGCHNGTWFKGFDGKGWNVKKTYTKLKGGPEFRQDKAGFNSNRWTSQVGLGAEMDNMVTNSVLLIGGVTLTADWALMMDMMTEFG